ncbi:binding-protein-dependent transport systems inner membrane component [Gracilibacillus halophilus YIM-C55.5]|uniref:Binding-protein-dependent transport systems inner membrane component n=1 Tax=Gracilibacillus halophilus YIM-C55.5 TaxID=1308866 RepID=N4WRI6_9BACI|nr:ABC transporter permease [Gracilibacillus halophilus]ENH95826.1 binding-protein-dependent transport systems inner membrane component [Gracilibacillus halophilus YIM-C55.5]
MNFLTELSQYMMENSSELFALTIEHILMVAYGIGLALLVGVPMGIIAARFEKLAPFIISITNILQLIPSLAMLAILMLYLGLGFETMVVGLFLYSLLPIVRNTYVGIKEVDPSIMEAGKGSGMTTFQLLRKVQLPLSIPFLMAGLRVASVIAIAVACIGPYIGAEGLGKEIISGISLQSEVKIYAGAIPATILAIIADLCLGGIEKKTKKRIA